MIGATLDRNGLRPAQYVVTDDGLVVLASELGVLDVDRRSDVVEKGRLQPGKMFLVDTEQGASSTTRRSSTRSRRASRTARGCDENKIELDDLPDARRADAARPTSAARALSRRSATPQEDLQHASLAPMAATGEEPIGSMGTDIAARGAVASAPQLLFRYFKQLFAQVTNPPIDPIREELVMSLVDAASGGEGNLLEETPEQCHLLQLPQPILTNDELAKLRAGRRSRDFRAGTLPMLFAGRATARTALAARARRALCARRRAAIDDGAQHPHPQRPRRRRERARRSRPARVAAVHHHLDPRGHAHAAPASSSRPARRARCTTSRCSSASAPAR